MCNVSDCSFWLNLVVHTDRLGTNQGRASSFFSLFGRGTFNFHSNPPYLSTFDAWLRYCLKNSNQSSCQENNQWPGWNGETYYNLHQEVVTNCVDRRLLQNAATLVTNRASYYKMPQSLLKNAPVMHQSIPAAPIPPRATAGHLHASSVPGVGH